MVERLSRRELLERAARGVGRVAEYGERGITMVKAQEIEAMAAMLVALGIVPIKPGARDCPARLFVPDGSAAAELYLSLEGV